MSEMNRNTTSGIKGVTPTPKGLVTQAAKDFAMTVALQKTEWQNIEGVKPLLFTLKNTSGRKAAGVIFICLTDDIEADEKAFTFLVSGINIDDLVADIATDKKDYSMKEEAK